MLLQFAVAGALGGLCKSLVEQKGRVLLPKVVTERDQSGQESKYVHLGFAVNVIIGAIVSYYISVDPVGAFTEGVAAVFAIEKLIENKSA